jgi:glycogen debranching enzyme
LNAIRQYIIISGDESILDETVNLKYPSAAFSFTNDTPSVVPLRKIVFGILDSHYHGIDYIEWNSGPQIDAYMKEEGFHVQIFVNPETGIIYGGNKWNCGTWMDKMGSSDANRGVPATPRYGAAVEINGLALTVLDFFVCQLGHSSSLLNPNLVLWYRLLKENFSRHFFPSDRDALDVIGGDRIEESRFRPNACFALGTLPLEMVDIEAATRYLLKCEECLLGPLGMRTLPSTDPDYNGVYDNSDITKGYNYHNGPEWVWLLGFFILASFRFEVHTRTELLGMMHAHYKHMRDDPWRSLPELTNMNGQYCQFSCPSQAWSVCTLLEALREISR